MSENLVLYIVLLVIFIVIVFVVRSHFKKKNSSWRGVVVDKGTREHVRNNSSRNRGMNNMGPNIKVGGVSLGGFNNNQAHVSVTYFVIIRTENEQEIKWNISQGLFEKVNVGDTLEKKSGVMTPVLVDSVEK